MSSKKGNRIGACGIFNLCCIRKFDHGIHMVKKFGSRIDSPHFDAGAQLFYCRMFLLLPEKLVNGPNGIGQILGIQKFLQEESVLASAIPGLPDASYISSRSGSYKSGSGRLKYFKKLSNMWSRSTGMSSSYPLRFSCL